MNSIANSSTRLAALVAGVAVAIALMGAVAVAPAQAQSALSASQVQAIVNLLQSFGADSTTIANVTAALNGQATSGSGSTGGSSNAACPVLSRSLQQGSTGEDVRSLQKFLNASADTRVAVSGAGSPGMESTYFGPATHAAVVKFQAKNNVSPIGVVGPATRAAIAAVCAGAGTGGNTGGNTGGATVLQGGEGELDINGNLGDIESSVDEGDEDVNVLGVEVEANDSDVMIERVDVDIEVGTSGSGSSQLDNYITEVSLMLDGKKLATLDVDEGDEDSDVYSFRFSGLKGVVREDDTAELYVTVSAVNNVDSGDTDVGLTVSIPDDGIRAVDAAGISDTYNNNEIDEEEFFIDEAASGDLDLSEGDSNPDTDTVQVDEEDDTNDVLVLAFDLEANDSDVNVDAIPVGLVTSETNISNVVKRAVLKMDGKTIKTKSVTGTGSSFQVLFNDLDLDIDEDDTAEFEVYVDLNDQETGTFDTGTTLYATTTGSDANWDVEDANGDDVTPSGSVNNSSDGLLTFMVSGISAKVGSKSAVTTNVDGSDNDYGTYTVTVDVTAFDEDAYISATSSAFTYQIEDASTGSVISTSTATTSIVSSTATLDNGSYRVNDGSTKSFTFTVTINPIASDEGKSFRLQLNTIKFGPASTDNAASSFTLAPAGDYETNGTLIND